MNTSLNGKMKRICSSFSQNLEKDRYNTFSICDHSNGKEHVRRDVRQRHIRMDGLENVGCCCECVRDRKGKEKV
jgi:hypothetical protein